MSAASSRRSTLWAFMLLLRLVVWLPVYLLAVLLALALGWIGRRLVRGEDRLFAASDVVYRLAGVATGRRWLDDR